MFQTHTKNWLARNHFIIAFSRVSGRYVKHFSDAKVQTFWLAISARSISFFSSFLFSSQYNEQDHITSVIYEHSHGHIVPTNSDLSTMYRPVLRFFFFFFFFFFGGGGHFSHFAPPPPIRKMDRRRCTVHIPLARPSRLPPPPPPDEVCQVTQVRHWREVL